MSVPTGSPESFRTSREERRRGLMPSASLRGRCQPWRLGRRPPRSARSSAFVWSSHTARLNQAHARAGDEQPPSHIPSSAHRPAPCRAAPRPSHIRSPASMFSQRRPAGSRHRGGSPPTATLGRRRTLSTARRWFQPTSERVVVTRSRPSRGSPPRGTSRGTRSSPSAELFARPTGG